MRAWCPAAAVALAVAAGPATAEAASVSVARGAIIFDAAPGEANRVAVASAPGVFRVHDLGAPLAPGLGCRPLGPQAVECDRTGVKRLLVRLGDGDDTVTVSVGVETMLSGDDGDDRLEGSEADDTMRGGPGSDTLLGGDGFDTLGGGPGADVLSGGTDAVAREIPLELDFVSYTGSTEGVRVTLDGVADDGAPGEGDNVLPDVEVVLGGRGDDTLIGSDAFLNGFAGGRGNDTILGGGGEIDVLFGEDGDDDLAGEAGGDVLEGGGGDDRLQGGDGRDELNGGRGRDVLAGGEGGDRLEARDGERDAALGGPGRDQAIVDRRDFVVDVELVYGLGRRATPVTGRHARPLVSARIRRARA